MSHLPASLITKICSHILLCKSWSITMLESTFYVSMMPISHIVLFIHSYFQMYRFFLIFLLCLFQLISTPDQMRCKTHTSMSIENCCWFWYLRFLSGKLKCFESKLLTANCAIQYYSTICIISGFGVWNVTLDWRAIKRVFISIGLLFYVGQ